MSYASDLGLTVGSKIKALEDSDYFSINEILTMVVDNEGWIGWNGGKCPVAKGTIIDVKYRGGDITIGISANMSHKGSGFYDLHPDTNENLATDWNIDDCDEDIIAYRLHVSSDTPSVASQEAITERLGDSPSAGIDSGKEASSSTTEPVYKVGDLVKVVSCKYGHGFQIGQIVKLSSSSDYDWYCTSEGKGWFLAEEEFSSANGLTETKEDSLLPLVTIVKDVTYSVGIKGTLFTFTQDEINELVSELQGFEDYE